MHLEFAEFVHVLNLIAQPTIHRDRRTVDRPFLRP